MSFKVICTDIDGTLLDARRELSDFTIDTFRSLPPDVHVILASSRMPSAMTHLQAQLSTRKDALICYNGGYVIDYSNSATPEILYSTFINADVCQRITSLTAGTGVHVSLYQEDRWYAPQWDQWSEREARITKVNPEIQAPDDVIAAWRASNTGAHKVMCMGHESEISVLERHLVEGFSNDIHVYRSRPTYLELAPVVISKGSALQFLLERRLFLSTQEVIAFGDNYNDVEMLKVAGKGIAVSNARKEVLDVADDVTLDSKADGVAIALRKYFRL